VTAADYGMLLTTLPSREDAARMADLLVGERLAACAQMIAIDSVYRWQGAVRREPETLLLIKTRTALFARAIERIRQEHPYDVPQIVGTPFLAGLPAYLDWIGEETQASI
jgi:periplasmic divalent cation tolerance protein